MILPKEVLLSLSLVKDYINSSQFQPAGIDLTLREIFSFKSAGKIDFDNKERKISDVAKIEFENDEVKLLPGAYKVVYNEYVKIPQDCIALCFPRSSLLRSGVSLECAVWDPGYEGRSESLLLVSNPYGIILKRNAKLGQLIFLKLLQPTSYIYSGIYKGENR